MAIKRKKLNRKVDLILDGDSVVDMPPAWEFTIDCPHHGQIEFDFKPYRRNGREALAEHMRDAIWCLRHEVVGRTLQGYEKVGVRLFWRFLDYLNDTGEVITHLNQIDRILLDRYLAWLEMQVTSTGKCKGRQLSIGARKNIFGCLKALLTNRQKRTPTAVSLALAFPRNPFPLSNQLAQKREPYSHEEQKRLVAALNQDLRSIHEGEGQPLTPLQVLVVHLLLLALATGRNPQSLIDLRRNSLRDHPIPDRELLVTTKRRGWTTHATSMRKSSAIPGETMYAIPKSIGEHFRFLRDFTAPLMEDANERDRELVFLWRVSKLERKEQVVRLDQKNAAAAVISFARRHALLDDSGKPLALNVARLRPTFATELYRRTRDIRRVQQALGHARAETTARHYASAPLEAERDHAIVLDGMVRQFARVKIKGKTLLTADGEIPLQDVQELLADGYSTGIARCRNPFREGDSVCKKFFACFKCPSMCVFEDDLWRLFSFYYRLLSERSKINPSHWLRTYGPIIRRIDADIASQFPPEKVEAARHKAQHDPHPTWK